MAKYKERLKTVSAVKFTGKPTAAQKKFIDVNEDGLAVAHKNGMTFVVDKGDMIVTHENGTVEVMNPDVFKEQYEKV